MAMAMAMAMAKGEVKKERNRPSLGGGAANRTAAPAPDSADTEQASKQASRAAHQLNRDSSGQVDTECAPRQPGLGLMEKFVAGEDWPRVHGAGIEDSGISLQDARMPGCQDARMPGLQDSSMLSRCV